MFTNASWHRWKFFDSIDHAILKGLPLGNLTSQCFANFYLNPFDLWVKQTRKARCYLRYTPDNRNNNLGFRLSLPQPGESILSDDITVFTQNVRIYQMGKQRFIEWFYSFAGGAKARLA